ncbi:MAG: hypothetical protein ACKV19_05715 [Verrucomicrobiales bacterium]
MNLHRTIVGSCLTVLVLTSAGCQSVPSRPRPVADLQVETDALARALRDLGPTVDQSEAERTAHVIVTTVEAQRLAVAMNGGPRRRNVAINLGLADWGLCWQWAEWLGRRLRQENLRTLHLHWACAHAGSLWREHNAVVVAARGQEFSDGLVVDPWRHGGRLKWILVADDRYPWKHEPWSETRWHRKGTTDFCTVVR